MEYKGHFGLTAAPFSITPDPQFLYMSQVHREALAHLLYGATVAGGFVQLTGEVGTGKTTICRRLLELLPPGVDVALILNPRLTDVELLATVCDELRIPYPPGTGSLKVLVDALYVHLLDAHAHNRRTVLIIDEAQNLSREVLEQIRLLSNLETPKEKLLQIILVGQPELVALLGRDDLRQLAQRITGRYHLRPFDEADTRAYIEHRMERAGQKGSIFTDGAQREVHRLSGGVPRLINVICDRALLGAYAHDKAWVDAAMVKRAAAEVAGDYPQPHQARSWRWAPAVAVAAAVVVGIVIFRLTDPSKPSLPQTPDPATAAVGAAPSTAPPAAGSSVENGAAAVRAVEPPASRGSGADALAAPRPASVPAASRPLPDVLGDASVAADKRSAFGSLLSLWGESYPGGSNGLACEAAAQKGLRCQFRTGNWSRLRRFNLPAVLELTAPNGEKRFAAVTAIAGDRATLTFGGMPFTYSMTEIDPYWDGAFVFLWRPALATAKVLQPGVRAREIDWLRRRLATIDGAIASARDPEVYDDALKERVLRFQRSRFLVADGVVGEDTLTHLSTAVPQPGTPLLSMEKM